MINLDVFNVRFWSRTRFSMLKLHYFDTREKWNVFSTCSKYCTIDCNASNENNFLFCKLKQSSIGFYSPTKYTILVQYNSFNQVKTHFFYNCSYPKSSFCFALFYFKKLSASLQFFFSI